MSVDTGIRAEALGKRYRITPADARGRRGPLRRFRREELWALRDVAFEVPRGSTLGVIGRNGAGKTTLLKILSRVTVPTVGRAVLAGKVGALLEVGTGFHPELTGRENVYVNGAILGMSRRDITRRFDEIVAFAEVERFIDTPVKRYSSGMSLRLAFSVAAHLDADVLLVDEVLAVGDASFQRKCLGKMGEVTGEGRTVVLVSHSMPTISSLADRCLWLDAGTVRESGPTADVVRSYLGAAGGGPDAGGGETDVTGVRRLPGHAEELRFERVRFRGPEGTARSLFYEGEPITVELDIAARVPASLLETRVYVKAVNGVWLFSSLSGKREVDIRPGRFRVATRIDPNHLRPGRYVVDVGLQSALPQDFVAEAAVFEIEHSPSGYDDPVLRSEVGSLWFDYPWDGPRSLENA
jgi:ABC-type polysaccharide/polyol phosphate transport system ATPase subunit